MRVTPEERKGYAGTMFAFVARQTGKTYQPDKMWYRSQYPTFAGLQPVYKINVFLKERKTK